MVALVAQAEVSAGRTRRVYSGVQTKTVFTSGRDEDNRFELYGYEFQILFDIVMKDGELLCEEARLTSPSWRYYLVHAYRYPDEPVWTAYQPHVNGTMQAHKNPLVATAQVLASII